MKKPIKKMPTHDKIIEVARLLFAKNGYEATSMADIAKAVGIEKPSLYYFFKDKDHIFGAVMASVIGHSVKKMEELKEKQKDKKCCNPQQLLALIVRKSIEASLEGGLAMGRIDILQMKKSSAYEEILAGVNKLRDMLKEFLKKHHVPEPELAEEVVSNAIHAYVIHAQHARPHASPEHYAKYIANLFIKK